MKEPIPFRVTPGGWRRPAQIVFRVSAVLSALVTPQPATLSPHVPIALEGVEVVLRAPAEDADCDAAEVQPDHLDDPLRLLPLLPFASTRLGIMTSLVALLPAGRKIWVEASTPFRLDVYIGDLPGGGASDQLTADVNALGNQLRPAGVPLIVHPFSDRPSILTAPVLSPLELACALLGSITLAGAEVALRVALPEVTGLELNHSDVGQALVHVDKLASEETVEKVARVLPELITPGIELTVARSGVHIPGLLREHDRRARRS